MKIIFMGTPEFAVPALTALAGSHDVELVVTQPDRPKGRGKNMAEPPVKICAEKNNIPVIQPKSLKKNKEIHDIIKGKNPELIVVAAYGNILPPNILNIPKHGCINVHASLLPKYRGAAPINWAIINGDATTGISIMKMDVGLDTGDVILSREIKISDEDNTFTMTEKLSKIGADVLLEAVKMIEDNKAVYRSQDEGQAVYAPMLTKKMGHIDWSKSMTDIINLVRGTYPWPGSYFYTNNKMIKIIDCFADSELNGRPAEVIKTDKKGIYVGCADGSIVITSIKPQGKRSMAANEYLRGNKIEIGTILE